MHNNLYGTSIRAVQNVAAAGKCCILDIDVQGARQVRKRSDQIRAIFVFLKPPSFGELEKRLRGRGTESEEQIQTRLATSKVELDRQVHKFFLTEPFPKFCCLAGTMNSMSAAPGIACIHLMYVQSE